MLAGKTATSLGRERVMNMRIESDFASVKRLQEETAEALRLLDDGKRFCRLEGHTTSAAG